MEDKQLHKWKRGDKVYSLSLSRQLFYNRKSVSGLNIECYEIVNDKKYRILLVAEDVISLGEYRRRKIKNALL